jgi:hypothetical protein
MSTVAVALDTHCLQQGQCCNDTLHAWEPCSACAFIFNKVVQCELPWGAGPMALMLWLNLVI